MKIVLKIKIINTCFKNKRKTKWKKRRQTWKCKITNRPTKSKQTNKKNKQKKKKEKKNHPIIDCGTRTCDSGL